MKTIIKGLVVLILLGVFLMQGLIASGWMLAPEGDAKYVLVLGAKIEGEEPSPLLNNRILKAQEYLLAHPNTIAVLCGGIGTGEIVSEAQVMKNVLLRNGIDEGRMLLEETSTSTWTNLKNALALIEEVTGEKPEKIMVSTSNYHAFRVGFLAKRLGVSAYPLTSSTPASTVLHDFTREMLAIVKSFLLDRE